MRKRILQKMKSLAGLFIACLSIYSNGVAGTLKNIKPGVDITVQGEVRSIDDGNQLPGVSVILKGTAMGTNTDADGKYSITVPNENAVLVFSFIGYKTQEVVVSNLTTINVTLELDIQELSQVVVVGYGTQKRSDITGSVSSVPKDRLSNLPVTNLAYAIQGTTAGLSVVQGSSVPGTTGTLQIRGLNSINANTSPFIVLDGVPFYGSTNDISPGDIESIEILKDASAVAIYGTRGANGVILITSKRGGTTKPQISYNAYTGIEEIAHRLEPMSPDAYKQKYDDYLIARNLSQTQPLPNTFEVNNYNAGITTNWLDAATQQGKIQEHNLSLRGGSKDVQYYVTGGFLNQKGVVKGYQYKRINVRSNLDVNVTDHIKAGASLFYTNNNYDGGRVNLLNATAMSPYSQAYDANGKYLIYPMFPELLYLNPLVGLTVQRIDRGNNLTGGGYAEVGTKFLKGLKYRLNGSYQLQFGRTSDYTGREANDLSGTANVSNSETANWVVENLILYNKDFDKHHVDFTGLYSAQQTTFSTSNIRSVGFINDELAFNNLGAGATMSGNTIAIDAALRGLTPEDAPSRGSWAYKSHLLSQMARINYSYDSRFLLSATARRDGFSAFGSKTSKFGVFPSFALGWNIHNESFMANVSNTVNELKLRFSYGKVGNQAIRPNQTATTSNTVAFPFNGTASVGVLAGTLGNAYLNWETTTSANLGLDFSLVKSRVSGSIEVYQTKTHDILLKRNIPNISGYTTVWDNLGVMQNRGLEITLKTVNVEMRDFKWETSINYSTFRNELLEIYGDGKDDVGNSWFIGKPLRVIYDYQKVGIWQADEDPTGWDPTAKPGDVKFKDQLTVDTDSDGKPDAADGVINGSDRVVVGTGLPKWYGGLTNTFSYKNLRLNIFLQASHGSLKRNPDVNYGDELGRRNSPAEVGYWTPANASTMWPSLAYTNTRGYGYPMDASYVRIKDITLSYSISKTWLDKVGIKTLMVYVAGRNLYTFTNWIGWDPENDQSTRGSGNWVNNYPLARTLSLGVNLTL